MKIEELQKIKEGSVLHNSWGYDQTNNDYCKIIKAGNKSFKCQKIGKSIIADLSPSYGSKVIPNPNKPIGKPFNVLIKKYRPNNYGEEIYLVGSYPLGNSSDDSTKIRGSWSEWDGKPDYDTER